MKIALIFTPIRLKMNWSTFRVQDEHVGIMPPLSLAYVAAIAERAGHEAIIIDVVAENLSLEDTVKRIEDFSPDLLGFTLTTFGFHQTLNWIRKIKEKTNLPVITGGWHLSLYPAETMHHDVIDYSIIGDAENVLPGFLRALESGDSLGDISGIAFREQGRVIVNTPSGSIQELDDVPFPARHLLKNERYFNILSRRKNFTVMLSARGCPYGCTFCDLNTKKFRMRSAINFVEEVELNYKEFEIREFDIYDSSFLIDKERVMLICDEIIRRRLKVNWTARSRVENVNKDLLKLMFRAGCSTLMYGIESGDASILGRLNKCSDIGVIKDAVEWTKLSGIKVLGFFMIGSPGETYETAMKTINFINTLGLDYIQVTRVTPFPNTVLYNKLLESGFIDYWREFTLDPGVEKGLPMVETELTAEDAMELVKRAYKSFYFNPGYILKALSRTRSPMELRNSLLAALALILNSNS